MEYTAAAGWALTNRTVYFPTGNLVAFITEHEP